MKKITEIARDIVVREGGLEDNPDDLGGFTNYGVSLKYAQGLGLLAMDLNHDGVIDEEDIKLVTPDKAVELFVQDFYYKPRFDKLDPHLGTFLFDAAVNHGPAFAAMFAQQAAVTVGTMPKYDVKGHPNIDGVLGPTSIAAVQQATTQRGWASMITMLADERKEFMRDIVRDNPTQAQFLDGWLHRVDQLAVDIFHDK